MEVQMLLTQFIRGQFMKRKTAGLLASSLLSVLCLANTVMAASPLVTEEEQRARDAVTGPAFAGKTEEAPPLTAAELVAPGAPRYVRGESLGIFKTTAYIAVAGAKTATGTTPKLNHTVSADWAQIPAGTKIMLEGSDIVYTVEDTGVKGKVVDLFLSIYEEAMEYGVRNREIFLVKEVY